MENNEYFCPICNEWIVGDGKTCSKCGYDVAAYAFQYRDNIICWNCNHVNDSSNEKCVMCDTGIIGCNTLANGIKNNRIGKNASRLDKKRAKQEIAEKEGEVFYDKYGNTIRVIFFLLAFTKFFAFFSVMIGLALLIQDKKSTPGQRVVDILMVVIGLLNSLTVTLTFM